MANDPVKHEGSSDVTVESQLGSGPRLASRGIQRRTVLRGLGVAMALPTLESMAQASGALRGALSPARRRLVYVYVPNGVKIDEWRQDLLRPAVEGAKKDRRRKKAGPRLLEGEHGDLAWPKLLGALAGFRDQTLILRGMTADKARANGDGAGDHARAAASFLTGVQPLKTEGRVQLGISADRVAAREIGQATRIRGLSVGLEPGLQSGQCDSGYACAYSGHVSWESEEVASHKEVRPSVLFDRLFRGGHGNEARASRERRRKERKSVLDFVREDARRLRSRLGASDRARLDEYETGLRELERQLAFDSAAHVDSVPDDVRPSARPSTFREEARLMGEILSYAFEADLTRVATFMYGNEGSGRRYTEVDVSEGHHSLSHHGGDEEKLAAIGRINQLHLEALAGFVESLSRRQDGAGSILDTTAVVYGSGIAEGNRHDHHDLPVIAVGGKHSGLRGGRTLVAPRETPLNNLHAALLANLGVKEERALFGDADGILDLG